MEQGGVEVYERWDVSDWEEQYDEQVGKSALYWLKRPDTDERWLFKTLKQETSGLLRLLRHDWTERVAAEVARRLGVPHSRVELALRHGRLGVVARNFVPWGSQLSNGSLLLPNVVGNYDADQTGEVDGYTLDAIFSALQGCRPPDRCPDGVHTAAEAFAGYLMLDAVVGNRDRHHDNWAVIDDPDGSRWLAPAFDEASCLGFSDRPDAKALRLRDGTVAAWAMKGRSRNFRGQPSLVALAADALARVPAPARSAWLDRLASVDDGEWRPMLDAVSDPDVSQVDRMFAEEILRVNRGRVLDACA